jgi:hypothetical protein
MKIGVDGRRSLRARVLACEQPGSGLRGKFGVVREGSGAGYIDDFLETIRECIAWIEFGENSPGSVSIPGVSGRMTIIIADVGVGPTCQRGKEEEERTGWGEKEAGPWAGFGCGLNYAPGPFHVFFGQNLFSFFCFI